MTNTNDTKENTDQRAILDEVLSSQKELDLQAFEPHRFVLDLLNDTDSRAKNILMKRFGLDGTKSKTLESLGKQYGITRERVRQIQSLAIKELKKSARSREIGRATKVVHATLTDAGGVMEQEALLTRILGSENNNPTNRAALLFIFNLADEVQKIDESDRLKTIWVSNKPSFEKLSNLLKTIEGIFKESGKPMNLEKLVLAINEHQGKEGQSVATEAEIQAAMAASKNIAKNPFGEFGLVDWTDIVPKGVRDKAYMVVRRTNKPMHFMKITEAINAAKFDKRKAYPQTVHNELIKDKRFVLVGRGMYALSEWGYKPGTVADVLTEILQQQGGPMNRNDLLQEVLKRRMVKRNTVLIGLQDKVKFKKVGREDYDLAIKE